MQHSQSQLLDRLARVFAEAAVDAWLSEIAGCRDVPAADATGPGTARAPVGSGDTDAADCGVGSRQRTGGTGAGSGAAPVTGDPGGLSVVSRMPATRQVLP